MEELQVEDVRAFKNFMRMDPEMFHELLGRMTPRLTKIDTFCRKALSPGLKLSITLRYLASGDSYHSLMYGFRVPHNSISLIVKEVCNAIVDEYADEVIEAPTTEQQWRRTADQFSRRWQFHHCLGAIDGKHIAIQCPRKAGSEFYNYKGFHSIILMALVDADYKFSWVDVGSNGSAGDAQVFNKSELKECLEADTVGVPAPEPLPHDDKCMPFFIVGDDAFALRTWLMKPFSKRELTLAETIFNYRLSRARRIVKKRLRHPGSSLPLPPDNNETETTDSGVHSVGMCLPSQPHTDALPSNALCRSRPGRPRSQRGTRSLERERSTFGNPVPAWESPDSSCKEPETVSERLLHVACWSSSMANGHDLNISEC